MTTIRSFSNVNPKACIYCNASATNRIVLPSPIIVRPEGKARCRSALDDIPGVGEAYQKRLLSHFGSVRAMREADVEDFEQVKGVGKAKAAAIYQALHAHDGQPSTENAISSNSPKDEME